VPPPARRVPFVGRERELGILLGRLEDARSDAGGVVLIAGEPGIGKTRLLAELTDRARADGWQLLVGHAYEHEGLPPYFPFIEALRGYIRDCPLPQLRRQLGRGAAELAVLIPQIRDRLPGLPQADPVSPETGRYLLYDRSSEFLLAIARAAPAGLLLVLEDLHWADASTTLLLQHVVRQCSDAPLVIVATYRTVAAGSSTALPDLLAELQRLDGIERHPAEKYAEMPE